MQRNSAIFAFLALGNALEMLPGRIASVSPWDKCSYFCSLNAEPNADLRLQPSQLWRAPLTTASYGTYLCGLRHPSNFRLKDPLSCLPQPLTSSMFRRAGVTLF